MAGRRLLVVVIACVGASVLVACGGGDGHRSTTWHEMARGGPRGAPVSDRTDLRSPDVDGRMDPASRGTIFACPRASRVEVFFDPRGTVALVAGGRPLVYGTVGTRAVNRACRPQGSLRSVPKGDLRARNEATRLTCVVPHSARFEVHPISVTGREVGSTVAVLVADLRSVVLSAVLEPRGARIYYGGGCRTG